jgi:hypothetical protein
MIEAGFGLQADPVLLHVIRSGSRMASFAARDVVELLLGESRSPVVLPTGADFTAFRWPFLAAARCSWLRSGD